MNDQISTSPLQLSINPALGHRQQSSTSKMAYNSSNLSVVRITATPSDPKALPVPPLSIPPHLKSTKHRVPTPYPNVQHLDSTVNAGNTDLPSCDNLKKRIKTPYPTIKLAYLDDDDDNDDESSDPPADIPFVDQHSSLYVQELEDQISTVRPRRDIARPGADVKPDGSTDPLVVDDSSYFQFGSISPITTFCEDYEQGIESRLSPPEISRRGSISPPASLDIFNPFEQPSLSSSLDDDDNDRNSFYSSNDQTSSISSSSSTTIFSETSSSSFKKWEQAFDIDDSPASSRFPSPFSSLSEAVAKAAGIQVGLGRPGSVRRSLPSTLVYLDARTDTMIYDDKDRVSQIVLDGPRMRSFSQGRLRMPSWDFGDGIDREAEEELSSLSVWGKVNHWMRGTERKDFIHLVIGGTASEAYKVVWTLVKAADDIAKGVRAKNGDFALVLLTDAVLTDSIASQTRNIETLECVVEKSKSLCDTWPHYNHPLRRLREGEGAWNTLCPAIEIIVRMWIGYSFRRLKYAHHDALLTRGALNGQRNIFEILKLTPAANEERRGKLQLVDDFWKSSTVKLHRRIWKTLAAAQYYKPRAHEAHDAGYRMYRATKTTGFPSVLSIFFGAQLSRCVYNNKAAVLKYKSNVMNIRQFNCQLYSHPYWLPINSTFSPLFGDKITDTFWSPFSEYRFGATQEPWAIKNKIIAVGRVAGVFSLLRGVPCSSWGCCWPIVDNAYKTAEGNLEMSPSSGVFLVRASCRTGRWPLDLKTTIRYRERTTSSTLIAKKDRRLSALVLYLLHQEGTSSTPVAANGVAAGLETAPSSGSVPSSPSPLNTSSSISSPTASPSSPTTPIQ
ncbi:hypothetical protein D9757_002460 [Collybiopsis confluens]|uniref:Uncharacterized protein n=1 Tax=Collybiopsis confluens TaxID=2823264 RepID=A0A8H5HXY6_9AGAR|nr:hypothetical protein D9757_002460 [Collybiopsis confluens]